MPRQHLAAGPGSQVLKPGLQTASLNKQNAEVIQRFVPQKHSVNAVGPITSTDRILAYAPTPRRDCSRIISSTVCSRSAARVQEAFQRGAHQTHLLDKTFAVRVRTSNDDAPTIAHENSAGHPDSRLSELLAVCRSTFTCFLEMLHRREDFKPGPMHQHPDIRERQLKKITNLYSSP